MQAAATQEYVETWLAGPGGHQFYTRTYPATFPKAVILFVHGFAEHVGRYEHIHVKYPPRGITVFAYDLRGYGRTVLDAEHRSKDGAYGKTNWAAQFRDIEHFGKHLAQQHPGVPLFLMGHSAVSIVFFFHETDGLMAVCCQGGGAVLGYFTRTTAPPTPEGKELFTAAIASSPCVTLAESKSKILRWTGGKLALLFPNLPFPAEVPPEVRELHAHERYLACSDTSPSDAVAQPGCERRGCKRPPHQEVRDSACSR